MLKQFKFYVHQRSGTYEVRRVAESCKRSICDRPPSRHLLPKSTSEPKHRLFGSMCLLLNPYRTLSSYAEGLLVLFHQYVFYRTMIVSSSRPLAATCLLCDLGVGRSSVAIPTPLISKTPIKACLYKCRSSIPLVYSSPRLRCFDIALPEEMAIKLNVPLKGLSLFIMRRRPANAPHGCLETK